MSNIEKIKAEIERLENMDYPCDTSEQATGFYNALDRISDFIDSLPEDDLPKIKGWIARNKDGSLVFCHHKPHRENSITLEWWGSCDADFRIYDDTIDEQFKDLKWEDEPVRVEIAVKRLDSLPEDHFRDSTKMVSKDLEEEIQGMYQAIFGTDIINRREMVYLETFDMIARHFAEWGAKHKKSLQVQETCKENPDSFTSLEEAAEKFARLYDQGTCDGIAQDCFIAGAKWQKSQMPMPEDTVIFMKGVEEGRRLEREDMMADAVVGFVCGRVKDHINVHVADGIDLTPPGIVHIPADKSKYKVGDKVEIVILKKDK